jgi:hypothetical protein
MHFFHGIPAVEQRLASVEAPLLGTQAVQKWFDGLQHDNYHVEKPRDVASSIFGMPRRSSPAIAAIPARGLA